MAMERKLFGSEVGPFLWMKNRTVCSHWSGMGIELSRIPLNIGTSHLVKGSASCLTSNGDIFDWLLALLFWDFMALKTSLCKKGDVRLLALSFGTAGISKISGGGCFWYKSWQNLCQLSRGTLEEWLAGNDFACL